MAEDQGKKEDQFGFTPEGETFGYISLDQARSLAVQTARETPWNSGQRFIDTPMVFTVTESGEDEDYYTVILLFRPEAGVTGTPGREKFFISKGGEVVLRQTLDPPRTRGRWPQLTAITGIAVVIVSVAIGALSLFGGGPSGAHSPLTPTPAPTFAALPNATSMPSATPFPSSTEIAIIAVSPTGTSVPTETPVPIPTPAPTPIPTSMPTSTPTPVPTSAAIPPRTLTQTPSATVVPSQPLAPTPTSTLIPVPSLRLELLNKWGLFGNEPGDMNRPDGIALTVGGAVYIVNSRSNEVQLFTSDGGLIGEFGSRGDGPGQFKSPLDIAVDSVGNVYVSDTGNNRVQKFNEEWRFMLAWGSEGGDVGQFRTPKGITADSDGFVYVVDSGNGRIQKFTGNGQFVLTWGTKGDALEQFRSPRGIATDLAGNVYVADTFNYRVQKFSSEGDFIASWGGFGGRGTPESPDEIAVDGEGNIYVVDRQAIYLLDVDGFRVLWDHDSFRVGGSPEQRDITVDSDGNIYVVRPAGNRLEIYGRRAVSVAPIPTPTPNLVLTPSPTMVPPRSGLLSSREAAPNGSLRCS